MMSLADFLDQGSSLNPNGACLSFEGQSWSYREVVGLSQRIARALRTSGIEPGTPVGIVSGNDPTAFTCVFGITRAGGAWCPINPRNSTADNAALLDLLGCRVLIYQPAFEQMIADLAADLPMDLIIRLGPSDERAIGLDDWLAPHLSPAEITSAAQNDARRNGDRIVALVGTGGTTGRPKGVALTELVFKTMTSIALSSYPFRGHPVYLALPPLTHAAGVLCFPILALGGEIVIMARPDIAEFLDLIPRHSVTHTFLPPTLIYALLEHPDLDDTDLDSLQCFWFGAAPIDPARLAEALTRIGPMAQLYGQTEAPMFIATTAPGQYRNIDGSINLDRLACAGQPSPLLTVAILDTDDTPLPDGQTGEIAVRGPLTMAGYHHDPTATADAFAHDWLHTGDLGYLDDGFLYIVGRAKDMIITGGFNVYATEVEHALMAHAAVHEAAVIGLPDPKWGERVTAVVELEPDAGVDADELIAFAKARIGSVKAPKQLQIWPDLPRTPVGKIAKTVVRDQLTHP